MIYVSIVLFAIAAVWGIYLAASILGAKKLTKPIILGHGVVAAIGLVLLIIASLMSGFVMLSGISVVLFVLAALGGAFMFFGPGGPTTQLIALHAVLAVAAFVLLLIYAFAGGTA
jgi:hypothetical protein